MYCPNPRCPDRGPGGMPAEYRDGIETCPFCGTTLAPGSPAESPSGHGDAGIPPAHPGAHETVVFLARDVTEAEMVRGLLENEGIVAITRVSRADGVGRFFSATWAPVPGQVHEVLVSSRAMEAAREVLEAVYGPDHPGLVTGDS